MNNVDRSAKIGRLIRHLEGVRQGELDMADRLIKNNPRLLKGLGENITQADYQNAKALSYHLGYGAAIDKAITEINRILSIWPGCNFRQVKSKIAIMKNLIDVNKNGGK